MKLSEILKDWPGSRLTREEREVYGLTTVGSKYDEGFNTALTSCDREIDREALAKTLYDKICHSMSWENVDYATYTMYIEFADHLISTMPTWLKPTERK